MGKDKNQQQSVFGMLKKPSAVAAGVDWSLVPEEKIIELIGIATSRGGAVRFGYTRDGGAYAVGLYYGGEHSTEYIRPSDDVSSRLDEFIGTYQKLPDTAGKSPS